MIIALTDDQQMLRDSVARFLDKEYDFAAREKMRLGDGYSDEMWGKFAELGWLGACIPEDLGGYGGPVEAMVLMQEFGRRLVLEPYIETAIVGGQLLGALPADARGQLLEQMMEGALQVALATTERHSRHDLAHVATRASPSGAHWIIDGTKTMVVNGDRADLLFVTARTSGEETDGVGISLFMVEAGSKGVSRRAFRTHDGRTAAEITFDGVAVSADALVGGVGTGLALVERASDHASAALCAEAVGSADHVLAATIEYLKTREQYGAPLAKLQVLQHRVAEMFVAAEQARVMAGFATQALGMDGAERAARVSAARVAVIGYTGFVVRQAVQLHGGMGVSEELDIAHHLKRWTVASLSHGDEAHHLSRYMEIAPALE